MLKLIFGRYVDAGGQLSFDDFIHPLSGLFRLAFVEGKPVITQWDDSLDTMGVIKPTTEELLAANDSPDLPSVKTALKASVDAQAETERLKYITAGAGQALTYMQKSDEARRYLAADEPDAGDYPLLAAEVGITAADMSGVATVILAAFSQWQQIGAAIEGVRLGAKAAIEISETVPDAQAAFDAIAWPAGAPA